MFLKDLCFLSAYEHVNVTNPSSDENSPARFVHPRRSASVSLGLAFIVLVYAVLLPPVVASPVKEVRRVLLLYSMGPSSPTISLIDRQIRALLEESPFQIEFYTEYMDTNLFPDEASQQEIRDWYLHKYRDRRPDVIVALATAPIQFMVDSHAKFFPNTPIVFCCASEERVDTPKIDSQFTGVWMMLEPAKTFELAMQLKPDTKHVVVVGGAAASDQMLEKFIRHSLSSYEGRLEFTYLTDLAMPELLERLKRLPERTIILYANLQQDAAGTHFMSATQALPMVASAANAPVFVMADTLLNQGAVGGYVTSFAVQGQIVSEITTRILKGEKPQDIPIVRGANAFMFDWRALQRWGLKETDLPHDSIVLNRQPTAWEAYKRYILGGISLCIAEALLIFGLLWQSAKRRQVQESLVERLNFESQLSELSTTFVNAPEQEVDQRIENSLARIGKFLNMQRITILEFSSDRTELMVTLSWKAEDVPRVPAIVKTDQFAWCLPRLLRGEVVLASHFSDLPEEASAERTYLRRLHATSLAIIPLQVGGEINGAVSFSSTKNCVFWDDDLTMRLKVIADIFSNALKRKRSESVLRESEERFRLVANTAPVMIWMSGADKLCTYFNKPWLKFTGRALEAELGNGWAGGVHIEDLRKCGETYNRSVDHLLPFQREYRLRRYDGEYRWIVDIGVPRFNADGSFAGYIGSALDVTERKLAEEALAGVSRKLIDAQEKERTRIARELHDDINQRLALLAVELEQLAQSPPQSLDEVSDHARDLSKHVSNIGAEVQAISHRLHSSKLEYLGVVAAAKGFCREFSEQHRVEVDFSNQDIARSLSQEISLCLFRVLQEALQNAVKHSGVRRFEVQLVGAANEIRLTVRDSGAGFNAEAVMNNPGLGLISMRERVALVDGTISISSKPMCGTAITVRVPIPQPASVRSIGLRSETLTIPHGMSADLAS